MITSTRTTEDMKPEDLVESIFNNLSDLLNTAIEEGSAISCTVEVDSDGEKMVNDENFHDGGKEGSKWKVTIEVVRKKIS